MSLNSYPEDHTPPPEDIARARDEVEAAYETLVDLADAAIIDFEYARGLGDALATLRRLAA